MTVACTAVGGRYPYALAPYHRENIRAHLERAGDTVLIRIEDIENCDRWEEFTVSAAALAELLRSNGTPPQLDPVPQRRTS